jgi:uncharacterized protein YciI
MNYYVLEYEVVPDFVNRRAPLREAHLKMVYDAQARGEVLMAGAVGDPPDGAVIVFKSESEATAETFARADPYVTHKLVTAWRIRQWHVVAGREA